jgi:hypothetical protein
MRVIGKVLASALLVIITLAMPANAGLPPAKVFVVSGSDINIVSRESKIPVSVQNNYDREVTIRVHASAPNPAVNVEKYVSLTIPANSRKDALIPISILSGGEYKLNVWVTTFNDQRVGETVSIKLTVNPDIEIMIIIIFGSIIAVLLGLGVLRMARRNRSEGSA